MRSTPDGAGTIPGVARPKSPFQTEEHDAIRQTVRRFVEREIVPHVDAWEHARALPRELYRKAGEAGPEFAGVQAFMERRLAVLEGSRRTFDRNLSAGWTGITFVLILAFVLLVAGWAGFVEWRFHRDLTQLFGDVGDQFTGSLHAGRVLAAQHITQVLSGDQQRLQGPVVQCLRDASAFAFLGGHHVGQQQRPARRQLGDADQSALLDP